jgi:hypothetical protein
LSTSEVFSGPQHQITSVASTLKNHMQHINDALNALTVDDNVFNSTKYHPNWNKFPMAYFE